MSYFLAYFMENVEYTTEVFFFNGQTEAIDRSLGDILRCLVGYHVASWDQILPVEFTYNSSVNKSTGRGPFERVTGVFPRKPIDLIPLPDTALPSIEANAFAKHICDKQDENGRRIAMRFAEFEEGNMAMVQIKLERYPKGANKKLHLRSIGPYKVLKKTSSNNCVLDLPKDMGISNVFNVEDLTMYHGHDDDESVDATVQLPQAPRLKEEIEDIVDQVASTSSEDHEKYLMQWKDTHYQIAYGSQMRNFKCLIMIIMTYSVLSTNRGRVLSS